MKRALLWSSRYLSLVPPPRRLAGALRPVAIKFETIANPVARTTFDVVLRDDEGYWPVLFVDYDADAMRFSPAYREYGAELTALAQRIEAIVDEQVPAEKPFVRIFEDDPLLSKASEENAGVLFPGITPFARLLDAADRWRVLAPLCAGRRVVDASIQTGYGHHVISPFARSVECAAQGVRGDIAVALQVDPGDVPAMHAKLRTYLADQGILVLHSHGPAGEQALRDAGLEPRKFVRPAGDVLTTPAEWFAYDPPTPISERPAVQREQIRVSPRPLRVLFALRETAKTIFGGDVVQVRQTAEELRRLGHRVEISVDCVLPSGDFDIVHLTNLTVPPDTLAQARSVERFEGAVIMMPIFTDHADETVWGMNAVPQVFGQERDDPKLATMLDNLAARAVHLPFGADNSMVGPPARIDMFPGYTDMQRAICSRVDFMIANAHSEMHRVYRYLDSSIPYAVAPSAADPDIYRPQAAEEFKQRFRLGDFVLVTGRFEGRKNQLMLAYALRESAKTLVMIGRGYEHLLATVLRSWLPRNVIIFSEMPEVQLAGAIAAARVVALPSWDEVVSLSALNAAACGTSIVLTRNSYEHEYIRDDAEYCDPGDWKTIAAAVDRAWNTHDLRAERRAALSERVRREYTWEQAALATEAAYYRVLASNPRGEARRLRYSS